MERNVRGGITGKKKTNKSHSENKQYIRYNHAVKTCWVDAKARELAVALAVLKAASKVCCWAAR